MRTETNHNLPLDQPLVLITGATRGLGRSLAVELAARGSRLCLLARGASDLRQLAQQLRDEHNITIHELPCDLSDSAQIYATLGAFQEQHGTPDVIVNNAGIGGYKPFAEFTAEELDQIIDINLRGVLHLTRAVLPTMLDRGSGQVINIASDLSDRPLANMVAYAASKFALRGFSLSLMREVKDRGIKVSLINPGFLDTAFHGEAHGERPAQSALKPDQLARVVVDVICQPGYQMIDELTVHAQHQDY